MLFSAVTSVFSAQLFQSKGEGAGSGRQREDGEMGKRGGGQRGGG